MKGEGVLLLRGGHYIYMWHVYLNTAHDNAIYIANKRQKNELKL